MEACPAQILPGIHRAFLNTCIESLGGHDSRGHSMCSCGMEGGGPRGPAAHVSRTALILLMLLITANQPLRGLVHHLCALGLGLGSTLVFKPHRSVCTAEELRAPAPWHSGLQCDRRCLQATPTGLKLQRRWHHKPCGTGS